MYYLSDICCACLKNDKSVINIKKNRTEPDSLINKLKICVSEVEWSEREILMCEPCIQKLNLAHEFKERCIKSAQTLQRYILELSTSPPCQAVSDISVSLSRSDVKKEYVDEYLRITNELEESQKQLYLRVKPTTHLFATIPPPPPNVVISNTIQNPVDTSFPNVFFNFIPAPVNTIQYPICNNNNNNTPSLLFNSINAPIRQLGPLPPPPPLPPPRGCDQNMFYNINNVLRKMVQIPNRMELRPPFIPPPQMPRHPPTIRIPVPPTTKPSDEINISQILTESSSEEVSVEIDPMCFDYPPDWEVPTVVDEPQHWENITNINKMEPKPNVASKYIPNVPIPPLTKLTELNNSVHARLKPKNTESVNLEDKLMNFLNVDHFMVPKIDKAKPVACEQCGQLCDSIKSLHFHTNQIHKGKFPYSCMECLSVYVLSSEYRTHMKKYHTPSGGDGFLKDVITLKDLSAIKNDSLLFPSPVQPDETLSEIPDENKEEGEYKCMDCPKVFSNPHAISRHRFRKHNQSAKKKYFIKGKKNAKCDICNREFSTHSYLQLHIKLHDRKNDSRLKVLNKNKYKQDDNNQEKLDLSDDTNATDENVEESSCVEEQEEDVIKSEEPERPKSPKGIKITINLKNIKRSLKEFEEKAHENGLSDSEIPMDVDSIEQPASLTLVNGDVDNDELPLSVELTNEENCKTHDHSLNCDELPEESSESLTKEKDSPEMQDSPISSKFKIVDGKPQCSFCLKLFSRKHDLKRHINNIHLKAIQYNCHLCNTQFYEAFHLTRHLRQHNSFMRCAICVREFSTLRDLKTHITSVHDDSTLVQCGNCGEVFSKIKHLQKHMYVHDKDMIYKCHICNLELRESRELSRHLVEHSGMYSCHVCHSTYSTDYELCYHLKNHSADVINERKYECEVCHNRYKKKRYLLNHMNNCHTADKRNEFSIMQIQINESV